MSEEIKKMIEALGSAFEEFKAENDKWKAELDKGRNDPVLAEKVEKINAEIGEISALKKQLELLDAKIGRQEYPGGGSTAIDEAKAKYNVAFDKFFRKGIDDGLNDLAVQANLSTLSDPDGGFFVPEEVDNAIDRVAETISAMRRICTVRRISANTYKKLVNKGGAASGWVAEKGSRDETDTPTLAEIAINTKEIYAMPAATQTLLDDATVDISSWLADEVGIEFNEEEGSAFITGNGVEKPKGIAAYTMVANSSYAYGKVGYIASGHASQLNNTDKLIDLQHALKSKYRYGALWLMNDSTLGTIRKLKDGDGNYIFRPGLEMGAPDTMLGRPIEIDDNVASIAASAYPLFFGNFKRAYMIIDRIGTRVLRDPYSSKPFVLFYTTKRVGGGIVMYEALKAMKIAA